MSNKTIFISHIHEEKDLAILIKNELTNEFSGFVDIFVSSDGISIPSGSNFLNRIQDALSDCSAAVYLISERSVKRNWINFELGAVWIKSYEQVKSGGLEIPVIPFCHSGVTSATLPQPLGNLNAINANDPIHLENAFKSLQIAMGGKGNLKTNFTELSKKIFDLEQKYTIGNAVKAMLSPIKGDMAKLISHCESQLPGATIQLQLGFIEQGIVSAIKNYESGQLKGLIQVSIEKPGTSFGPTGAINGAEVTIAMKADLIKEFRDILKD